MPAAAISSAAAAAGTATRGVAAGPGMRLIPSFAFGQRVGRKSAEAGQELPPRGRKGFARALCVVRDAPLIVRRRRKAVAPQDTHGADPAALPILAQPLSAFPHCCASFASQRFPL